MFDLSWGHMAIVAVVALLVLGPNELPNALRTASSWMRAARKLAGEFQSGVNDIIREADLEDARKQLQGLNTQTIQKHIENTVDPTGEIKASLTVEDPDTQKASVETAAPTASLPLSDASPAASEAVTAADLDSAPTLPPSVEVHAVDTPPQQPAAETADASEKS
jgi:sec-independent protein translocase protein TatB